MRLGLLFAQKLLSLLCSVHAEAPESMGVALLLSPELIPAYRNGLIFFLRTLRLVLPTATVVGVGTDHLPQEQLQRRPQS